MIIKKTDIFYYSTYLYLIFNFFIYINNSVSKIIDLLYFVLMAFFIAIHSSKNGIKITKKEVLFIIIIGLLIIIQLVISPYGISDILKTTIVFFIVYYLYINNLLIDDHDNKKIDIIYFITIVYLVFFLFKSYMNGVLFSNTTGWANAFYLQSVGDKNLSSIVMFLFFYFCYKKKYILGIIISIIYIYFLGSRMLYIGFAIFALFEILNKYKIINMNFIKNNVFLIIIISQFLVICGSYYLTFNISTNNISAYKDSLMDSSNAMRVRSNVYASETIKNSLRFVLYGYDSQILDVLGVRDILNSPRYLGYRLVQPHSLLLNLILRYGIVYSIVYLFALSVLLKGEFNRKNLSLLISYLFMNMILPLMFSGLYLLFFMFDMKLNNKEKNRNDNSVKLINQE